jgi:hypothetical protein
VYVGYFSPTDHDVPESAVVPIADGSAGMDEQVIVHVVVW